jgi:hypothetical protein
MDLPMKRRLLSSLFCCLVPALAAGQTVVPADNAVPGWKKSDPAKTFAQADLYGYIDGGAELFLEFGFEQLVVQKYKNGADEMAVEAYRMTDPVAAAGIYLMKAGRETPEPAFTERNTANKFQLTFQRNRYYVIVNNLAGKDALRPAVVQFASAVAAALPPAVSVPELALLPRPGLVADSARLIRGPYGLQAVYTLGDGDILQLGRKVTAVAGNYKKPAGTSSLILVDYPDPASAGKALGYLQANLDKYLKITGKSAGGFVFQDYNKKFGAVRLTGKRLEIRVRLDKTPTG